MSRRPPKQRRKYRILTAKIISEFEKGFMRNAQARLAQNAATEVGADKILKSRDAIFETDHSFSLQLDKWQVTAQEKSGRCWLFAGLNLMRSSAMKRLRLENFEFSQNYAMFWDKFEKANYFLEAIIDTVDMDTDDREVAFLLNEPISDGGQWNMFVNLIEKYGAVPKSAMPETAGSSNTGAMNRALQKRLRAGAFEIRDLHGKGATNDKLGSHKLHVLRTINAILRVNLGNPPSSFTWQWMDKKRKFTRAGEMTPRQFVQRYCPLRLKNYACLVNDPRPSNPYGRTYTVKRLGNIVGGEIVRYLNVDIEIMKKMAVKSLQAGEPVWMGCDVGQQFDRKLGIQDLRLLDYESVYGDAFEMNKSRRLLYGDTKMTHAMLFTGVDIKSGKTRRWRIENSWGKDQCHKGFISMTDEWFNEFMFEIAVKKTLLPAKLQKAINLKPRILPPWDPMGSLAE